MIATLQPRERRWLGFRTKLLVAMMLPVASVTALGLLFAQHKASANAKRNVQVEFQNRLDTLQAAQEIRYTAMAELCRALARKSRIHAALEDDALDLLYPSARDELHEIMETEDEPARETAASVLHARFYRFLDAQGRMISPPDAPDAGRLEPADERRLALGTVPDKPQIGYLLRKGGQAGESIDEVIAMPIFSSETGETIAALVLGFKPVELDSAAAGADMKSGLWSQGRLHLSSFPDPARAAIARALARAVVTPSPKENSFVVSVDGAPYLLFYKRLNPGSLFPPADEVCLYPLAASLLQ
ncbi:MAG: hypothetical protein ABSE59_10670, partial [Opitutaceae bacterium]